MNRFHIFSNPKRFITLLYISSEFKTLWDNLSEPIWPIFVKWNCFDVRASGAVFYERILACKRGEGLAKFKSLEAREKLSFEVTKFEVSQSWNILIDLWISGVTKFMKSPSKTRSRSKSEFEYHFMLQSEFTSRHFSRLFTSLSALT